MHYTHQLRRPYSNELYHHGIKNQKWGVRRFQNPDGTLTEAGKQRYAYTSKGTRNLYKDAKKQHRENERAYTTTSNIYKDTLREEKTQEKRLNKFKSKYGIDKNSDRSKMSKKVQQKLDRREANAADARRNREQWERANEVAVKEAKDATTMLNKMLSERGKKPLNSIPTKTLNNGKEIVNGKVFTAGETVKGFALTAASFAAGMAAASYTGSPIVFYQDFVPSKSSYARKYREETERQKGYNRFQEYNKYRSRKKQGYYK